MRRLSAVALLGLACASPGMPPGGPPDVAAPQIVEIIPDSGKVGVRPKEVLFRFDEVVSERPSGAATLSDLFLISPRDGVAKASWHRDVIAVKPEHGWRNNTAYTVILLRGLADIRGNVRNTGASTFFSTGTSIPSTRIAGNVFDWVAGTPASGALVESFIPPDSAHPYVALADSNGAFAIEHLPAGTYLLRAYEDRNRNLTIDPSEPWDSTSITLTDSVRRPLLLFVHDTVPPRIRDMRASDSVTTLHITFDKPIDPGQTIGVANFAIVAPDSTRIPILSAAPAVPDTTALVRPAAAPPRPANPLGARPVPRRDTTTLVPKPVMPRPVPVSEVVLKLRSPLAPKTPYRVHAIGIRGLLGKTGDSERTFTPPAPPPPPPAKAPAKTASSTPSSK
ncbi:MAG TPA: Ig-like domain-containing domain [Gemmatimonadaceae bacterium]